MEAGLIRGLASQWGDVILVCGKCSKKLGGGFGSDGTRPLAKALRRALGVGKGRKAAIGVVETRCLGVCPKRAVVVARRGEWLIVPAGTGVSRILARLNGDRLS